MSGTGKIVKGRTWTSETCTAAKLNAFVDDAYLQNLDQTDLAANYGTIITSASEPTDTDALWRDSATSNIIKYYTGSAWAAVGSTTLMSSISTDGDSEDLADGLENYISGCDVYTTSSGSQITVAPGTAMINGIWRRITSAIDTNPSVDPDSADYLDVWILADAAATTFTVSLVDSGTTPGGSSNPGTNGRLIGSVRHNGSGVYNATWNFRDGEVYFWDYFTGNGTTGINITVNLGVTFDAPPVVFYHSLGTLSTGSVPHTPGSFTANHVGVAAWARSISTTQIGTLRLETNRDTSTLSASSNHGYTILAKGRWS